jgi:alpha-L-fucosidase
VSEFNQIISERNKRTKWFLNARFGMFIHWGLYAIPARGEWVRSVERISDEDYRKYFDEFNPKTFDPQIWAKAARDAGMKYAVLTAKHHDGFCLFDSKLTDYKSTNTPFARDAVKEFLEAFRAEGIKVGLYYSLLDWHHEDYPAYKDAHHPMRDNEDFKNKPCDFSRYIRYMHGQVRELLTNYGKLDLMWFDFSYDNMTGETWKAAELVKMARELQPHIIIDNRLDGTGSIKSDSPLIYSGDFASPEQLIPANGVLDKRGSPIPWESCITTNNNWGYHSGDKQYKSAKLIIRKLVECVSKNGNLLLNIGPNARGDIPDESMFILYKIGQWMKKNGRSIYDCGASDLPKPEWGRFTWNEESGRLYAHVFEENIGAICIQNLANQVKSIRLLSDGSEIVLSKPWNTVDYPDDFFFNFGIPDGATYPLPDEIDTVVEIELK